MMEEKTIMLACAAGMSTSLLVSKMQKAAEQKELAVKIFAVPVSEAAEHVKKETVDVLLLGPQVRFMLDEFKAEFEVAKGIPVEVIAMTDYGMMNGENVLQLAQTLMK